MILSQVIAEASYYLIKLQNPFKQAFRGLCISFQKPLKASIDSLRIVIPTIHRPRVLRRKQSAFKGLLKGDIYRELVRYILKRAFNRFLVSF